MLLPTTNCPDVRRKLPVCLTFPRSVASPSASMAPETSNDAAVIPLRFVDPLTVSALLIVTFEPLNVALLVMRVGAFISTCDAS